MKSFGLLLVLVLGSCRPVATSSPTDHPSGLKWMEDDYASALRRARLEKKPLLIDAWAPWCHTCLSMRSFVFTDPKLGPVADQVVWLAIDTEKPTSAPVLTRFPVSVWPTLFIVDPTTELVHGRWLGAGSADEVVMFVTDGARSIANHELRDADPLTLTIDGDRLALAKSYLDAAKCYEEALAKAPPGWSRRGATLVALIDALHRSANYSACADLALLSGSELGSTAIASDFTYVALECAGSLSTDDPRSASIRTQARARLEKLVETTNTDMSADDLSDAYALLRDVREELADPAGARKACEKRVALLEQAARVAPNPSAASTYNWARAESYLYLGRGEDAILFLRRSEEVLPGDYNPPHQLARVFFRLRRHDDALAALERAIAKVSGPRRAGILALRADIMEAKGDLLGARNAVEAQLSVLDSLPEGQRQPQARIKAQARLDDLTARGTRVAPR